MRALAVAAGLVTATVLVVVLIVSRDGDTGAGNPESRLSLAEAQAPLPDAPKPLQKIRSEANLLRVGGVDAFEARLDSLNGIPVVVNAWASWCGPCRHEFPFFQAQAAEHGGEIAFLGVDVDDSEDAAKTFLSQLPLPYPSYADPDSEIAERLDVGPGLPNTIFIDSEGKTAYHWRGGYRTEEELASQIERFAR